MSETGPEYDETTADGLEPQAQPFEEPVEGGDPASTEGEDVAEEDLDTAPADPADEGDDHDDESA